MTKDNRWTSFGKPVKNAGHMFVEALVKPKMVLVVNVTASLNVRLQGNGSV
jgi:hypothetical protein